MTNHVPAQLSLSLLLAPRNDSSFTRNSPANSSTSFAARMPSPPVSRARPALALLLSAVSLALLTVTPILASANLGADNPNAAVIGSTVAAAAAPALPSTALTMPVALLPPVVDSGAADPAGAGLVMPGFIEAFMSTWAMILVSELGDKTFFIAAILAMSHSRRAIFLSAGAALAVMTVLSVGLGMTLPALLPKQYTHLASCVLFVVFGVKLLHTVLTSEGGAAAEEMQEVEEELAAAKQSAHSNSSGGSSGKGNVISARDNDDDDDCEMQALKSAAAEHDAGDVEAGEALKKDMVPGLASSVQLSLRRCLTPIMIQCFTMTFLAEWGDRSQISTIAMAASKNPYGVTLGSFIGHAMCTGLAVVGGKLLASRISERAVNAIGGALFLVFAVAGFVMGPA